ncbi:hypothetical protein WG66_005808 [Moniliophthora roreri]|nr:hypothetical protein WG66_005808 [Moniliophthora roreri]
MFRKTYEYTTWQPPTKLSLYSLSLQCLAWFTDKIAVRIMTLRLSSVASSGVMTIPQRHSCNSEFFAVLSKWVDISVVALGSLDSGDR